MAKIVPAILEAAHEGFLDKVSRVTKIPGVSRIQVDFGDGVFVPGKLLSVSEMDSLNPAYTWEAHLMIQEPQDFLDYQICGFKTIIVHFEAFKSVDNLKVALKSIESFGMEPAICIKPATPIAVLDPFLTSIKHFQIMSVEPGAQGQAFIESSLKKVADFRKLCPTAIIEIDGGVNETNIKKVAEAGADLIIAGSAVVGQENPAESFEKLTQIVNA